MGEEIAFENGRISDFRGLVTLTLTLDRVILHTVMHHSSPNFIEIEETCLDGRTDGRTDIWDPLLCRLGGVDLTSGVGNCNLTEEHDWQPVLLFSKSIVRIHVCCSYAELRLSKLHKTGDLQVDNFTARRYASAVYAVIICPSDVRLSVCLSDIVTRRYCTKTAKCTITQTTYDSSGTLVFWCQKFRRNSNGVTPNWAPNRNGVGYSRWPLTNISLFISETVQDRDIYSNYGTLIFVCALSNGTISSDLEWPLTTRNHHIFTILYRLSYLRSGQRCRL